MKTLETNAPKRAGSGPAPDREEIALRAGFAWAVLVAAALDLLVVWQLHHDFGILGIHFVALMAVWFVLDETRPFPVIRPTLSGLFCGGLLLVSAAIKAHSLVDTDNYQHFFALVLAVALAVSAFGFRGTARLWKVGLILGMVSAADQRLQELGITYLHLKTFSALLAAAVLEVARYPVVRTGDIPALHGGSVQVTPSCSAAVSIVYLLRIALFVILVYRSTWWRKGLILAAAFFSALLLNAVRIAIMAILNARGDHLRFDYWHSGPGSNVFFVLYVGVFLALCTACLHLGNPPETPETKRLPNPALA